MNMQQPPLQLVAAVGADGSLAITPLGNVPVLITFSKTLEGEKTAIINFGGFNQALVTYDATGRMPLTYMLYNCAPDMSLELSVRNILAYLTEAPTLH